MTDFIFITQARKTQSKEVSGLSNLKSFEINQISRSPVVLFLHRRLF